MARALLIFVAVLAFAGVFVSARFVKDDLPNKSVKKLKLLKTEKLHGYDRSKYSTQDFEVGSHHENEQVYVDEFDVENPSDVNTIEYYYYEAEEGEVINYIKVENKSPESAVLISEDTVVGYSGVVFGVVIFAEKKATLVATIAVHNVTV